MVEKANENGKCAHNSVLVKGTTFQNNCYWLIDYSY
jgi:hypothetical protein